MKVKLLIGLCWLWPLLLCHGASVRMLTGEIYEGKIALNPDGMTVTADDAAATKVDLSNLQAAVFNTPAADIPPGVLLINGSYIPGNVKTFGAPAEPVGGLRISLPGAAIAQIVFARIPRDKLPPAAGGQTGALLPNGDFFPGTVDGMKENRVQVNSLLIGPQRLAPGAQTLAVVLRDVQGAGAFEVRAREGYRYLTSNLRFDHDAVLLTDSILGNVTIKANDLVEINAGAGRYLALAEAKPARVDAPAGANAANAFQIQPAPADGAAAILSTANATVSYAVPQGFSLFASGVALPKDAPAAARLIFDVYADGRLIFGSPIVAAGEKPQPVRVNLGGARFLTLRAEPARPGSGAAAGAWINPMLLRPL